MLISIVLNLATHFSGYRVYEVTKQHMSVGRLKKHLHINVHKSGWDGLRDCVHFT